MVRVFSDGNNHTVAKQSRQLCSWQNKLCSNLEQYFRDVELFHGPFSLKSKKKKKKSLNSWTV